MGDRGSAGDIRSKDGIVAPTLTYIWTFQEKPYSFEDKRNYSQICLEVQLKRKTGMWTGQVSLSYWSIVGYYKGLIMLVMLVSVMNWAIFFVA